MVAEGVEAVTPKYHNHQYNAVAVFTHRHAGDDREHSHHTYAWNAHGSYTTDADGRRTQDEATPLDDLRIPLP